MWRRWAYPFAIALALLIFAADIGHFHHPDSNFLRAKYTQNLIDGHGLVYNADERVLLSATPLPMIVLAGPAYALGDVEAALELVGLLLIVMSIAALWRILVSEKANTPIAWVLMLLWLVPLYLTFGGLEAWLACWGLLMRDAKQQEKTRLLASLGSLAPLISPLGVVLIALFGLWRSLWVWLPSFGWVIFALFYYGSDVLDGVALNSAAGSGFLGPYSVLLLLPLLGYLSFTQKNADFPEQWRPAVIFGLVYAIFAVALNQSDDATLLVLAILVLAIGTYQTAPKILWGFFTLLLALVSLAAMAGQPDRADKPIFLTQHVALADATHREAFYIGRHVTHLDGRHHPQYRALYEQNDLESIIIATAPELIVWPDTDIDLATLGYTQTPSSEWQRDAAPDDWQDAQPRQLAFGQDFVLSQLRHDGLRREGGGHLRLGLLWQMPRPYQPDKPLYFRLNLIGLTGDVAAAQTNVYAPVKWRPMPDIETYHLFELPPDIVAGVYNLELSLNYDGGIIARHIIAEVVVPVEPTKDSVEALTQFSNDRYAVDLIEAELAQGENEIVLDIAWRAQTDFENDFNIFVHITAPEDVQPIAQADIVPGNGVYPTRVWQANDRVEDRIALSTADLTSGDYVVRFGLYNAAGRLQTTDGDAWVMPLRIP